MFNAERLLGQLMGQALGGQLGGHKRKRGKSPGLGGMMGGMSTGTKAQLGLGLLGVAMAAFEHYQNKPGAAPQPMAGPGAALPPPPPGAGAAVPPPPPMPAAQVAVRTEQAMHLLRAMITAAHADGLMDAQERESILGRAREAGLDAEEIEALDAEIRAPFTLEQLVVRTPAHLRPETYAAALIAITADTAEERAFLDRLAGQLQLDDAARRDIHAQLGVDAA
ncbi:MAG: tellurite resistance TerB family protein [Rhizobium sp.]|nr:tellurite resistance TerB family protein [Rhizobium sp.]